MAKLCFLGPNQLLAWLRFHPDAKTIRREVVTDEVLSWPREATKSEPDASCPNRVLLVSEGNCVSVYVDGNVIVRHADRPVVTTAKGNDRADELLRYRLGMLWTEMLEQHRKTFFVDPRPLVERYAEQWPLLEQALEKRDG